MASRVHGRAAVSGALVTLTVLVGGGFAIGRHHATPAAATPRLDGLPIAYSRAVPGSGADYVARGGSYSAYVSRRGATLTVPTGHAHRGLAVGLRLIGAHAGAARAADRLPGTVNDLTGSKPSQWRTGLSTFGAVRYAHAWPGTDVTYHGRQGSFEYDFDVQPGADPGRIALRFAGQDRLRLAGNGDLLLDGAGTTVRQAAPTAYQVIDGHRTPVDSAYVRRANGTVGFRLGAYDRTRAVTIDPVLLGYSTYFGGSSAEGVASNRLINEHAALAVDATGAAYFGGLTFSPDLPVTTGAYRTTQYDGFDMFVAKLNPAGTALSYATYLGGNSYEYLRGIAVDADGNAYVAGETNSTDFPSTAGASAVLTQGGQKSDGFVTKLTPTGGLAYSRFLGAAGGDNRATDVGVDATGAAYVTGYNQGIFPTTAGALDTTADGGQDGFLTKIKPDGSAVVWSTFLGGSGTDHPTAVAVDADGHAWVTGDTKSTDFPTSSMPPAYHTSNAGSQDAFVSELASDGSSLVYSTYAGGTDGDYPEDIAIHGGDAYVVGRTYSDDFPMVNAFDSELFSIEAFAFRISPGSGLKWSTYLGGHDYDGAFGVAADSAGDAYITGYTGSTDYPVTTDAFDPNVDGTYDAFLTHLGPSGANVYSTYLGGAKDDVGSAVATDSAGNYYVLGGTNSSDFLVSTGAYDRTYNSPAGSDATDVFVTKLGPGGTSPPTGSPTATASPGPGATASATATRTAAPTPPPATQSLPIQAPRPDVPLRVGLNGKQKVHVYDADDFAFDVLIAEILAPWTGKPVTTSKVKKPTVLARSKRVTIQPKSTRTITLTLSKAARKKLRRKGKLKVVFETTTSAAGHKTVTTRKTLTLRKKR